MKNLLVLLLFVAFTASLSAQKSIRSKKVKSLSKSELAITTNGLLPALRYNRYFNEKTILHIEGLKTGLLQLRSDHLEMGIDTWIERRKYKGKFFLSHGPSIGGKMTRTLLNTTGDEPNYEFSKSATLGYGIGGGIKIGKRWTIASRYNPTFTINDSGTSFRAGGLFQAYANLYAGFRF